MGSRDDALIYGFEILHVDIVRGLFAFLLVAGELLIFKLFKLSR